MGTHSLATSKTFVRKYISFSILIPLVLFLDVATNFGIYIMRAGLCTGANLARISSTQTFGAGALPPLIPYTYAPQADIMTTGLDMDSASLVRSLIWLVVAFIVLKSIWSRRFMTSLFNIFVLLVTLEISKVEKAYSCDLAHAHANFEANIRQSSKFKTSENPASYIVKKIRVSDLATEFLGQWGEPTCSAFVLKTHQPADIDQKTSPSWKKAREVLGDRNATFGDALRSIASLRDDNENLYLSLKPFAFVEGKDRLQFFSLLACDPTRMPAF